MVAIVVSGCGETFFNNLVTGTFDGGKLIALNSWVGGNSVGNNIDAYADVADQTAATLDFSGPEHWRCAGTFRNPSDVPSTGGLFESDQDKKRDRVVVLPSFVLSRNTSPGVGFGGPAGTYKVTIEVPSVPAKFSHTWSLGDGGYNPITKLYGNQPECTQIADMLMQQQSIVDQRLLDLQNVLDRAMASPKVRSQLRVLLDQARQAKISGDGQAVSDKRNTNYQSAAAILTTMVQLAGDSNRSGDCISPNSCQLSNSAAGEITNVATNAAGILLQTGLS